MPHLITEVAQQSLTIEIGGMPVRVNTSDRGFLNTLSNRYAGYVSSTADAEVEFDVQLASAGHADPDVGVRVARRGERWSLTRGDF